MFAFFRWTRVHVADPLKEIPVMRETQIHVKELAEAAATMSADTAAALNAQTPLVATMQESVETINHELHSDEGGSVRDSIDRNENMTKETADQVEILADVLADTKTLVASHIQSDDLRWLVVDESLKKLSQGQEDAATIAAKK